MSRKRLAQLAAMTALAMRGGFRDIYDTGRHPREVKPRDNTRYKKNICRVNMTEHEFIIKGEVIMARNRKTALKIYANHHK